MSFVDRLQHAWNVFTNKDELMSDYTNVSMTYSYRPDRPRLTRGNERSIVTSVFNRISTDASSINIRHIKLDENERYIETIDSGLNRCLNLEANIDQTGRAFLQDTIMSMLDEGCVAMVPIETTLNPRVTGSYDINSIRTGKIVQWAPADVKVNVYNERTGRREDIWVPKKTVSIVENPFYAVMNEPNSTMQRLIRKLNLLDAIDEQSSSGKLDLIIQLPYVIKTEARKQQAENRRKDIEEQLSGSKYGIAYTDGTERITQLNRPVENNLMKQIEYLTSMLYSQLGISASVLDGTANESTMLNYQNRTIKPIADAIADEFTRKWISQTAFTQGHRIRYFRDPFKVMTVSQIAESADKLTRNEIMTSNEVRDKIGLPPSSDPEADSLRNKNLNQATGDQYSAEPDSTSAEENQTDVNPWYFGEDNGGANTENE